MKCKYCNTEHDQDKVRIFAAVQEAQLLECWYCDNCGMENYE